MIRIEEFYRMKNIQSHSDITHATIRYVYECHIQYHTRFRILNPPKLRV